MFRYQRLFLRLFLLCVIYMFVTAYTVKAQGDFTKEKINSAEKYRNGTCIDLKTALQNPSAIRRLDLSKQGLTAIPPEVFKLPNLEYLNLSNNKIKEIPKEIKYLHNLKELILSYNQIEYLADEIGDLRQLRQLILHRNLLTRFPIGIVGLKKLEFMDVTRNNLFEFELDYATQKLPKCNIIY